MFEKLVLVSDAMGMHSDTLIPAMKGCPACGVMEAIASPVLGTCPTCGHEFQLVDARILPHGEPPPARTSAERST